LGDSAPYIQLPAVYGWVRESVSESESLSPPGGSGGGGGGGSNGRASDDRNIKNPCFFFLKTQVFWSFLNSDKKTFHVFLLFFFKKPKLEF